MSFPIVQAGSGLAVQPIAPACAVFQPSAKPPRVFLTTVRIQDDHIWANGLFQNVYVIYKLFELMGCEPWLLVDNNENNKESILHKKFRMMDFKEYIQQPFTIVSYIEIGMSCDPSIRRYFRSMGAKVSKLYLGNILNIDIETVTFFKGVNFSHHVAGELDEIWVSPHYDMHAEYAGSINGMCGKTRIAPYVWDPMFVEELGNSTVYDSTDLTLTSPRTFLIMEPNISFQKNALIPIFAIEAYYRKFPERVDQVVVINGQRFKENPYFLSSIAPTLTLVAAGKLNLLPRASILNVARVFKSAIVLQHQVNNEYNYSYLEWLTLGFPLIHNVPRFKEYAYYYDGNDFDAAESHIEHVVQNHDRHKEVYRAHAKQLAWQFSIYNPENIAAWRRLALRGDISTPLQ